MSYRRHYNRGCRGRPFLCVFLCVRLHVCAVKRFCATPATSPCMCGTRSCWSATRRAERREQSRGSDLREPPASSARKHLSSTAGKRKHSTRESLINLPPQIFGGVVHVFFYSLETKHMPCSGRGTSINET